jgi:hypothetical protein
MQAFTKLWWIDCRDVDPVRGALLRSNADLWYSLVKKALVENRRNERHPCNWAELAVCLGRNPTGVWRLLKGKINGTLDDLRSLASILQIPLKKFFLGERIRLTLATDFICGKETCRDEAKAYVVYREVHPVAENGVEMCYVQEVFKNVHGFKDIAEVKSSIEKVANYLEPELKKAYTDLVPKRELWARQKIHRRDTRHA